jgi:hypothetical protein
VKDVDDLRPRAPSSSICRRAFAEIAERFRCPLRARRTRYGMGAFKIDRALDALIPGKTSYRGRKSSRRHAAEIVASERDAGSGALSERPRFSQYDDLRSRAPRAVRRVEDACAGRSTVDGPQPAQIERRAGFRDDFCASRRVTPADSAANWTLQATRQPRGLQQPSGVRCGASQVVGAFMDAWPTPRLAAWQHAAIHALAR